jgi:ABC-type protease/lipase transport system fused ATPase/permease subunit
LIREAWARRSEGKLALRQAMVDLKARGAIVVLIAHRPSILAVCDQVLSLANGTQQEFGPRDEILRKIIAQRLRRGRSSARRPLGPVFD